MNTKQKFDLVFSLGGNCTAAHNLQYRGLRIFSLPFDWTYIVDEKAIYNLAEGFQTDFKYFLLKENLQELPKENYSKDHKDKIQYKDTKTEYYFVNHFLKSIDDINEYNRVKNKFDKRVKRLDSFIKKSKRILLLLSINFSIDIELCKYLINILNEKYPDKIFYLRVMSFGVNEDDILKTDNIEIYNYSRKLILNDYIKTTEEWNFLDTIDYNPALLTAKWGFLMIDKLKKGYAVVFFPVFNTIFYIKLYILGLRIHFIIGRNRLE